MARSLVVALAVALAGATPILAQKQTEPAPPKLVENIDVRVINVDVVVTDKKGNPVRGLTKDDFELLENNVPKTISNFYEVVGGAPKNVEVAADKPEAAPVKAPDVSEETKRRIIFYIDNLSLSPFNRNRVFTAIKDFVKTAMRPGDEAMVATYNRSMKVRLPFTSDRLQLDSVLDTLAKESGLGVNGKSELRSVQDHISQAESYDEAVEEARGYAQSVEHDLRQGVSSLNALMGTLAGVEGKKILVLTSEGFPMQPGLEAFYYIDEVGKEKGWSNAGGTMLQGMSFNRSDLIQEVAKEANANGITMYTVHAAGLSVGTDSFSAENSKPVSYAISSAAMTNTTDSMKLMAQMTGGLASVQTNNFADAFKRIQRDLDSYYSIGYRAGTERVDRQRYIEVHPKNRNYIARARQTFVEKSVGAEMGDRVIANLLYRVKDNDLHVLARIGTPKATDEGYFSVPIDIQIPMESLTLLPQGDAEYVGGFDVYVVVANKDNDMSDVAHKSHQLHVPAADMKTVGGKYYTYTLDMLMERGLNKISIGVVDSISNVTGFTREQIIAQDLR